MESASMEVVLRTDTGKGAARKLRHVGKVPGILYGEGGQSQPILLDSFHFETMRRSGAHQRLLDLRFADGAPAIKALVREMQIHPVSRAVLHVDLQRVSMEKRVRVTVPIVLVGKPEGVKTQGGILEHHLRDVEVECLPTDIPDEIRIEVGSMQVGQAVHISDLERPGIHFLNHPGTTVATVSLPAAERSQEEPTTDAAALAAAEPKAGAEGAPGAEGDKGDKGDKGKKSGGKDKEKGGAS